MSERAAQRHMPRRRAGHTTSVTIGGERFYMEDEFGRAVQQTGRRDDGGSGERRGVELGVLAHEAACCADKV
jgi:hypothetical protein